MVLDNYQAILFPYAYNILGSSEDAKDVVQDIMIKNIKDDLSKVENKMGYMIKSVINQSINLKKRNSRMTHDQVWLPEPFSTEKTDDPINKEQIITYSLLVLLEKLTPKERAVMILKEAFDYSHEEIAEVIDISKENSRKLLSRAKAKIDQVDDQEKGIKTSHLNEYMDTYVKAIREGDTKELEKLLSEDIMHMADGGEKVNVLRQLTLGKKDIQELLLLVYDKFQKTQTIKLTEINHQPALLYYENDMMVNCQVFELNENKIQGIYSIVDPEKLKALQG